jgi:hypothetical protein
MTENAIMNRRKIIGFKMNVCSFNSFIIIEYILCYKYLQISGISKPYNNGADLNTSNL